VEHFLGKEEVTGSSPVVGFALDSAGSPEHLDFAGGRGKRGVAQSHLGKKRRIPDGEGEV
jgi:hypothetical protein